MSTVHAVYKASAARVRASVYLFPLYSLYFFPPLLVLSAATAASARALALRCVRVLQRGPASGLTSSAGRLLCGSVGPPFEQLPPACLVRQEEVRGIGCFSCGVYPCSCGAAQRRVASGSRISTVAKL